MSETINTGTYQNKPSGGGCGKVMLWLLLIALILSCLCCAGFIGSGYYIAKSLKNGLEEDPVVTQQKTVDAFGELNLPENIKPQAFFTLKLFGKELGFAGIYSWTVANEAAPAAEVPAEEATDEAAPTEEDAEPASSEDKGAVFFYSLSDFLKGNEKDFVEGISQGLTDNKNKDVTVKRSETVPVTVNGKTSDFTFSWMEESKGGKSFMMASGSFESKTGADCNVVVYLPGEPSQETVTEVLENIQK